MESLVKLKNIPLVESGIKIYSGLKKQNRLVNWGFNKMEGVVVATADVVQPAVKLFNGPIGVMDRVICRSIDFVEAKIPSIYLPPEMMYSNTKEYMTDRIVRPVLQRASSVKHIGTAVLDSRVSSYAADRIDGAIDVADKYIEKYLPPEDQTDQPALDEKRDDDEDSKTVIQTLYKSQRFSRKLKRRLTQRTFAEARALKKHSKEAVHIVIYAAEMIICDPKLAITKFRDLWHYLSDDEPGNQARPQTLEQLLLLLTRESARKVVHLTNYATASVAQVPISMVASSQLMIHQAADFIGSLLQSTLNKAKEKAIQETTSAIGKVQSRYGELQQYSSNVLERLAIFLSGRLEGENIQAGPRRRRIPRPAAGGAHNNMNGVH